MGGFESSTQIGLAGRRLDLIAATQHDRLAATDYALLRSQGLSTARDSVRWHLLDRGGRYDFAPLRERAEAAERAGVQVIWDLCHYGWPDDLDIFSAEFVPRFAAFAGATARFLAELTQGPLLLTPVNEMSFLSWAAGEAGYFHPFQRGRGYELKRRLVRAFNAAALAVWEVQPEARILTAEPVIHVVAPGGEPQHGEGAAAQREEMYQAWDMVAGRTSPELGGDRRHLDVLGVNFYHSCQWQYPDRRLLGWDDVPLDERWLPFHRLLEAVWRRYGRPLYVSETSHFGSGRAAWLRHVTDEVALAQARGVPILGVCLYPILDRPDWDEPGQWHNSGLWDLVPNGAGELERVLNVPYAAQLRRARSRLPQSAATRPLVRS